MRQRNYGLWQVLTRGKHFRQFGVSVSGAARLGATVLRNKYIRAGEAT